MQTMQLTRAAAAATSVAVSLGLDAKRSVVLHASNRTTLGLLPCDVVARIAPVATDTAAVELDVARQLQRVGAPIAPLDPRVPPSAHRRDGYVITFWAHLETPSETSIEEYAGALARLHEALRAVDVVVPNATDRIRAAEDLLTQVERTPRLSAQDRELLQDVLAAGADRVRGAGRGQVLHGEPHSGNLLSTAGGPVLIDWETCCWGPVEFDLAHAPAGVGEAYPGVDLDLLRDCRLLTRAVATTWRCDRDDRFPGGVALGAAWLRELRAARAGG